MRIPRPALRYHGGKYRLAPWITAHLPAHRIYVEPYAGSASVLLAKPRSFAEVINDLDSNVVTLFRVLRDPVASAELARVVRLTPFSREEFEAAFVPAAKGDVIEQSRRLLVRSWMGFSTNGASAKTCKIGFNGRLDRTAKHKRADSQAAAGMDCGDANALDERLALITGFRAITIRSFTTPAHDWARWPDVIPAITARLQGVCIEQRPALHLLRQMDGFDALFYVDPPYVKSTRADGRDDYQFEMTDQDHVALSEVLHDLKGMVVLSGYDCDLYAALYTGWHKVTKAVYADRAKARTECLWLNSAAMSGQHQPTLIFDINSRHEGGEAEAIK